MKQRFKEMQSAAAGRVLGGIAAILLLGLGIAVWAGPGYLKSDGPAPLRFQPPPKPVTNLVVATVKPAPVEPVTQTVDTNFLMPPDLLGAPIITEVKSPDPIIPTNLVTATTPTDPDNVSAQMLLGFFNTNGTGNRNGNAGVIVPANVNIPMTRPGTTPSSTTGYTNTP